MVVLCGSFRNLGGNIWRCMETGVAIQSFHDFYIASPNCTLHSPDYSIRTAESSHSFTSLKFTHETLPFQYCTMAVYSSEQSLLSLVLLKACTCVYRFSLTIVSIHVAEVLFVRRFDHKGLHQLQNSRSHEPLSHHVSTAS